MAMVPRSIFKHSFSTPMFPTLPMTPTAAIPRSTMTLIILPLPSPFVASILSLFCPFRPGRLSSFRRRRPCRRRTSTRTSAFCFLSPYELVTISEKSAIVENSVRIACSRARRFCRTFGIRRIHQDLVEEQVDLRAAARRSSRDAPCTRARSASRRTHSKSAYRSASGPASSRRRLDRRRLSKLRLPQDILNAFEAGGQRLEIFRRTNGLHGEQPLFDVHQVVPAGGQNGVDFVVLEAANFFEVVADAVEHEFLKLRIFVQQVGERAARACLRPGS